MRRRLLSSFDRIAASFLLLLVLSTCSCSLSCLLALADANNINNKKNNMPPSSASARSTCSRADTATTSVGEDDSGFPRRRKWLVVDFDCTLTQFDTTPTLPLLAALHSGDDDVQKRRRLDVFAKHEEEYFGAYSAARERLLQHGDIDIDIDKNNIAGGEDDGDASGHTSLDLHEALEALDDVSTSVTKKVSESSCLAGLPLHPHRVADIISGNDELRRLTQLQEGCIPVVANAHKNGWGLAVLSINWFPNLIEASFVMPLRQHIDSSENIEEMDGKESGAQANSDDMRLTEVWCNSIDEEGVVQLEIPGAAAKRQRIRALKERLAKEHQLAAMPLAGKDILVIYVGDSSADLLGLLEAHIGIMVGRSSTLEGIADRWNIPLTPLKERRASLSSSSGLHENDAETIWMADGWEDIEAVLADL